LTPLSWLYGSAVGVRNLLYDRKVLASIKAPIPVVSVGNVSVGGTGKTPLAAYLANRLRAAGATPALVMRGVGGDESRTYEMLAPGVPVVVDADRVRGVTNAAQNGADVAVLDDAFQHRRIQRDVDIVLVSAERSAMAMHVLPAGSLREPFANISRATLVVLVRKAAPRSDLTTLHQRVNQQFPGLPVVEIALTPAALVCWSSEEQTSVESLRDKTVFAVAGIGDPTAFFAQLKPHVRQLQAATFSDHYPYSEADVAELAGRAAGVDAVVCTLKDAVKLGPIWPRQGPELWYVSQRLEVEKGEDELQRILASLLDLRPTNRA
jgi:tetraacyldisaccharide 4'-kinase